MLTRDIATRIHVSSMNYMAHWYIYPGYNIILLILNSNNIHRRAVEYDVHALEGEHYNTINGG